MTVVIRLLETIDEADGHPASRTELRILGSVLWMFILFQAQQTKAAREEPVGSEQRQVLVPRGHRHSQGGR